MTFLVAIQAVELGFITSRMILSGKRQPLKVVILLFLFYINGN
jgi:hypothetical protein